jgi:hypothetical protein
LHRLWRRAKLATRVSTVVYALFETGAAADAAELELRTTHGRGGGVLVQLHTRAPLDANILPEDATEYGRNIAIAMVGGGVFMAVAGAIVGALDLMLGLGVGMGIALGFVTGLLMGLVGAMQAGTRRPKAQLRALEPRLRDGCALLVVEVDSKGEAVGISEELQRHDPIELDVCRGI